MNVIIYGKPKETAEAAQALRALDEAGIEFLEESSLCELERLTIQDELILLDGDDSSVSWQYLVGRLRTLHPKLKIVLMSRDTDNAAKAYKAGVFDYLLKPIKKTQLERVAGKYKMQAGNKELK